MVVWFLPLSAHMACLCVEPALPSRGELHGVMLQQRTPFTRSLSRNFAAVFLGVLPQVRGTSDGLRIRAELVAQEESGSAPCRRLRSCETATGVSARAAWGRAR